MPTPRAPPRERVGSGDETRLAPPSPSRSNYSHGYLHENISQWLRRRSVLFFAPRTSKKVCFRERRERWELNIETSCSVENLTSGKLASRDEELVTSRPPMPPLGTNAVISHFGRMMIFVPLTELVLGFACFLQSRSWRKKEQRPFHCSPMNQSSFTMKTLPWVSINQLVQRGDSLQMTLLFFISLS